MACSSGALDLDLVALDQRVGEELLAHPLDLGPRRRRVGRLDLEIDDATDAGADADDNEDEDADENENVDSTRGAA